MNDRVVFAWLQPILRTADQHYQWLTITRVKVVVVLLENDGNWVGARLLRL
jgi:hypothetical protein